MALHTSARMVEVLAPVVEGDVSTIWPRWLVLAVTWPRPGSLAQSVACGVAAFLVFVMSAKYVFVHYHWFVGGLFFAVVLLHCAEERPVRPV